MDLEVTEPSLEKPKKEENKSEKKEVKKDE